MNCIFAWCNHKSMVTLGTRLPYVVNICPVPHPPRGYHRQLTKFPVEGFGRCHRPAVSSVPLLIAPTTKKTKPTTQIKMPCSFFPLPSTENSTFADLAPLPRLAGERRATLSTVPSDRIGSQVCLRIQFNQMPLPVGPFNKARPPPLPARDLLLAQQS